MPIPHSPCRRRSKGPLPSGLLLCLKNKFLVSLPRQLESFSSALKDTRPSPTPTTKINFFPGSLARIQLKTSPATGFAVRVSGWFLNQINAVVTQHDCI